MRWSRDWTVSLRACMPKFHNNEVGSFSGCPIPHITQWENLNTCLDLTFYNFIFTVRFSRREKEKKSLVEEESKKDEWIGWVGCVVFWVVTSCWSQRGVVGGSNSSRVIQLVTIKLLLNNNTAKKSSVAWKFSILIPTLNRRFFLNGQKATSEPVRFHVWIGLENYWVIKSVKN